MDTRKEQPEDFAAIESITEAAFKGTPYGSGTEQFIAAGLREDGQLTISLVLPGAPQEYFQSLRFTESSPSGDVSFHTTFGE